MENNYYVYAHIRPDTGEIFYIGKGSKKRYKNWSSRNRHWQFIVNKVGKPDVLFLADGLSEQDAYEWEKYYINKHRDKLTNVTDGGDAPPSWKGRKRPPRTSEHTEKIASQTRGVPKGPRTLEHQEKLNESLRGRRPYWVEKPVIQFSLEGEFIAEYTSIVQAGKALNLKYVSNISACAKNQIKSSYGYVWKYKK